MSASSQHRGSIKAPERRTTNTLTSATLTSLAEDQPGVNRNNGGARSAGSRHSSSPNGGGGGAAGPTSGIQSSDWAGFGNWGSASKGKQTSRKLHASHRPESDVASVSSSSRRAIKPSSAPISSRRETPEPNGPAGGAGKVQQRLMLDVMLSRLGEAKEEQQDTAETSTPRIKEQAHGAGASSAVAPTPARSHSILTSRSVDSALTSASCLSISSLATIERAVGRALAITEGESTTTQVTLTRGDIAKIKDPATLKFLSENSEAFANYFAAAKASASASEIPSRTDSSAAMNTDAPKSDANATAAPPVKNSTDAITEAMEALQEEINTFITAVDGEGHEYEICANALGEVTIPVDGDNDDQALAGMAERGKGGFPGAEAESIVSAAGTEAVDDAEWADFCAEHGIATEIGSDEPHEGEDESKAGEASNDGQPEGDIGDEVASENGSTAQEGDQPVGASTTADRRALTLQLRRSRNANYMKPTGGKGRGAGKPAAGESTATEGQQQNGSTGNDTAGAPNAKPAGTIFSTTYVNKMKAQQQQSRSVSERRAGRGGKADGNPQSVAIRSACAKLSPQEEARVDFILDQEDWESAVMAEETAKAKAAAAEERLARRKEREAKGEPADASDEDDDETKSVATAFTTATSSSSHAFSYNVDSAEQYAPANGGYGINGQLAERMADIDAALDAFATARGEAEGPDPTFSTSVTPARQRVPSALPSIDETLALLEPPTPKPSQPGTPATANSPSKPPPSLKSTAKPSPSKKLNETPVKDAPATAAAEEEKKAAERRRALGNRYAQEARETAAAAKRLNAINDALGALSNQVDQLFTPPFAFVNQGADRHMDPSAVEWPEAGGVKAPTETDIAALLDQARAELAAAPLMITTAAVKKPSHPSPPDGKRDPLTPQRLSRLGHHHDVDDDVNGVPEEEAHLAEPNGQPAVPSGAAVPTAEERPTAFQEILRERLRRATEVADHLEALPEAADMVKEEDEVDELPALPPRADEDEVPEEITV